MKSSSDNIKSKEMKKGFFALVFAMAAIFLMQACGDKAPATPQGPPPAVPVTTYTVAEGSATYFDQYPGTVNALNQVDIRPQVSGYVTGIFFKDGQHVNKGDKLYALDQQQYAGSYQQALANLNVAKANLARAQQDADRYTDLAKQDAIAKQTLDHALADLEATRMQVAAAQANVSTVQTNLKYATIYAPFSGTIGISQVKLGASVSPGQTVLNTLSADNPLAVDFAVDDKQIARFGDMLNRPMSKTDSTFTIVLPDGTVYPYPGHLSFLDRAVDPQTGTITARVIFPNPKNILRPGLTCNLRVQNRGANNSLLIPFKAVVEQMAEYFVYTLGDSSKVHQKKISIGARINDKVVVKDGLKAGEEIVVDGVQKIREGATVKPGAAADSSKNRTAPASK